MTQVVLHLSIPPKLFIVWVNFQKKILEAAGDAGFAP